MGKKKTTKKVEKTKKESFFDGVKTELSKVKWPNKKEVLKYTIATIIFIIILVAIFEILTLIIAMLGGA